MTRSSKRQPPPTLEEATQEVADLWAAYRAAREQDAPAPVFEALRGKVRSALSRARKRASEPGFTTLVQQLVDLGEYIKRFKPREAAVSASPDELLREVDEIRRALPGLGGEGSQAARRALAAKAASIHQRIEDARALAPDADEDHDAFVDVEEQLWDLEALLGTRR